MGDLPVNWSDIAEVLDQGWIFHLGLVNTDGIATSMPMLYVRDGSGLLLHGGVANATLKGVVSNRRASGNVTLVDGLIVARSANQSSVAYRSVSVAGTVSLVEGDAKTAALDLVTEGLLRGRTSEIRPMTSGEVRGTVLLRLEIESAVLRASEPLVHDAPSDQGGPEWAGVIPIEVSAGEPRRADDVSDQTPLPMSVRSWVPPRG